MKNYRNVIFSIFVLLFLVGCASHYSPQSIADPYGFFSGLWHGAIAGITITVNIISWILSILGISFFHDVQIIGKPNTGFFYYTGFAMGFFWLKLI